MKKLTTVLKTALREFYDGLDGESKDWFLTEAGKVCGLSTPTMYRRLNDPSMFSLLEKEAIAKLAKKKLKNLFPAEH